MGTINKENPWKGLNFYREKDKNDFYGREEDIERLSLYIINNAQTVLFGKSGIGKSSILNAGVFPVAREHGLFPVPIKLIHNGSKSYLQQIKEKVDKVVARTEASTHELVPIIDANTETLWEYLHRTIIYDSTGKRVRLLLVIDQFEEIFTLQQDEDQKEAFFAELADLLNDVTPLYIVNAQNKLNNDSDSNSIQYTEKKDSEIEIDLNISSNQNDSAYLERSEFHIVLTLRDDFLGCLERYTTNIPCMKTNRYALQPLNKAQAEKIITMPRENLIAEGVPDLIIKKVIDKTDNRLNGLSESYVDAAMLSLYLSRLYMKRNNDDEQITVELVKQFSDNIIKDFYEDAVKGISVEIIERIEDELLTYDDRRNNVSVKDFEKMGIPEKVIRALVDKKKLLRQFNYGGDIRVEFMHDVLCKVVSDRIEQRELRKSQERERLLKKKTRRMWFGFAAAVLFLAMAAFVLWDGLYHDVELHYGIVVKRFGWFEGLERLSENEASCRNYHYVLKFHGRWNEHPYAMEVRNGYGELTTNHDIKTYIVDQYEEADTGVDSVMLEKLKSTCQWEFVRNESESFVVQERCLDKEGNLIVANNRALTNDNKVINTYVDDYGFPLMLRDSIYFYVRTSYDEHGYESLIEFFDDQGMPIVNKDSVYQIKKEYLSNGIIKSEYGCFFDGRPTMSKNNNCGYVVTKFTSDSIRCVEKSYIDDELKICKPTNANSATEKYKYDIHGRIIETSYWDAFGQPDITNLGIHAICKKYNERGQVLREYYLNGVYDYINAKYEECSRVDSLVEISFQYDKYGNEIERRELYKHHVEVCVKEFLEDGTCIKNEIFSASRRDAKAPIEPGIDTIFAFRYYNNVDENIELYMYYDHCKHVEKDSHGNSIRISYYDAKNQRPIEHNGYHERRTKYDYQGNLTYYEDSCYNIHGVLTHPINLYEAIHKVYVDSVAKTISVLEYDMRGKYVTGYRNCYDDVDFKCKIWEESINDYWQAVRNYKNNMFYYRCKILHSVKPSRSNDQIGWYGIGEIGEPSLIHYNELTNYVKQNSGDKLLGDVDFDGLSDFSWVNSTKESAWAKFLQFIIPSQTFYAYYYGQGKDVYYDEHGKIIDPSKENWKKIPYIEIINTDSNLGFRDGDIVLACNNWKLKTDKNDSYNDVPWLKFIERIFVIARVNNEGTAFEKKKVKVPANIDIDKHIRLKKMHCTSYEISIITLLLEKV